MSRTQKRGFTLIELIVSIAIFAMMTALLVVKYGNFNQSVLFTNLAYDVALTIRTAQTYGLSVKNRAPSGICSTYQCAYGVHFTAPGDQIQIYGVVPEEDNNESLDYIAGGPHEIVSTYNLKRGAVVSRVCAGALESTCYLVDTTLDIVFKRPDPNAILCFGSITCSSLTYAEIEIQSTDGDTRRIVIRENGQISIKQI